MRADHSITTADTLKQRGGRGDGPHTTAPAALGVLAAPSLRIDPAALLERLRDSSHQQRDPAADTLDTLRRTLLSVVDSNTRQERSFGLGARPSDPLDVTEVREHTHRALIRLEGLYEGGGEGLPLSVKQRDLILQANTVLREFLISLAEITSDGTLNRSDTGGFLRQCVAIGQILGQMSLALDSAKGGAGRALGDGELPVEVLNALAQRLEVVAAD